MFLNRRTRCAGFTLVELLIVIAVLGILAVILVPMFIESMQKSRQKKTMAGIREFATGIAEYWTDNSGAGAAGAQADVGDWPAAVDAADLEAALVPDYLQRVDERDAWNNLLDYHIQLDDPPRLYYALVRSPGRTEGFEGDTYTVGVFDPRDYDQDIVWGDGSFIRAPASYQSGS